MVSSISRYLVAVGIVFFFGGLASGCGGDGEIFDAIDDVATDSVSHPEVDSGEDAGQDTRPDVETPDDVADTVDGNAPDVTGDADVGIPDAFDHGVDPDAATDAEADADPDADDVEIDTGNPCIPDCSATVCGLDPVCGTLNCGDCIGAQCVLGQCVNNGCYRADLGRCVDSYSSYEDPPEEFLSSHVEFCVEDGGVWGLCPAQGRLLSAKFTYSGGGGYTLHYYHGLYCDSGEAVVVAEAKAQRERDLLQAELVVSYPFEDPSAHCSAVGADRIACQLPGISAPCLELGGGIAPERGAAFSDVCTGFFGGTVDSACPFTEVGVCERGIDAGVPDYRLKYVYDPLDKQSEATVCNREGGWWLAVECTDQDTPHGTCQLNVHSCGHQAGEYEPASFAATVVEKVAGTTGYSCCHEDPQTAYDQALADLLTRDDLERCEPCVPDCTGIVCGVDPVCGQVCGGCTEPGQACVQNACVVVGCNVPAQGICYDRYYDGGDSIWWEMLQQDCESGGGIWGTCPATNQLAIIRLSPSGDFSIDQHFYLGLFCGMGNVQAYTGVKYSNPSDFTVILEDYDLVCQMPDTQTIACNVAATGTCEELGGGIAPERAAWFTDLCEDIRGGEIGTECPPSELASCEYSIEWMPGIDRIFHFYDAAVLDAGHAECNGINGTWRVRE